MLYLSHIRLETRADQTCIDAVMQCTIRSCKTEDCVPLTSGPKTFSRRKRAPAQALQTGGQAG